MNVLDYLANEFASFEEKPLNPVDSAALSQFCMVQADGIVPPLREQATFRQFGSVVRNFVTRANTPAHFADLLRAENYHRMFTGLAPDGVKNNLLALAASPRFRSIVLRDYLSLFDPAQQTQFAAITYVHQKDFAYIGFRGTDTSLTGWRENFNMVYAPVVPAQQQAVHYLETVAPHLPKRLFVGGHSKGGNLALYAALHAKPAIQDRIQMVFTHDGPGFKAGLITDDQWKQLDGRIHRSVPQDSVVGMLMDMQVPARAVASNAKGLDQHSMFTWEVAGDDFAYVNSVSDNAVFIHEVMSAWLARYSDEEAERVVDALFQAIEASGVQNASQLFFGGTKNIPLIAEAAKNIDPAARDTLLSALGTLAEVAARHATQDFITSATDAVAKLIPNAKR